MLQQIITEKDAEIIKHVSSVKAAKIEEPSAMIAVEIWFTTNDFFDNESLKFTVRMDKEEEKAEEEDGYK